MGATSLSVTAEGCCDVTEAVSLTVGGTRTTLGSEGWYSLGGSRTFRQSINKKWNYILLYM